MSGLTKVAVNLSPAAEAGTPTSRDLEPSTPDVIRTSADLTWQQHQPGGNTWSPAPAGSAPRTAARNWPGRSGYGRWLGTFVGQHQLGAKRLWKEGDRASRGCGVCSWTETHSPCPAIRDQRMSRVIGFLRVRWQQVMDAYASGGGGNGNPVGSWNRTGSPLQRRRFVWVWQSEIPVAV